MIRMHSIQNDALRTGGVESLNAPLGSTADQWGKPLFDVALTLGADDNDTKVFDARDGSLFRNQKDSHIRYPIPRTDG